MARSGSSSKKVANGLVVMSSAAVLAVYSAGYVRTRSAADRVSAHAMERRIEREAPPVEPALRVEPASPRAAAEAPPVAVHPNQKRKTKAAPKLAEPIAVPSAPVQVAVAPAAPVADPPAAPVVAIAEQKVEIPVVAPAPPAPPAPPVLKDGKYQGWGSCRHGDIQATVVVEGGKIASAQISDCETRYPCDVIDILPGQVVTRQSANVRRIAGATESSDAFYWAVVEALKQAK